MDINDAFIQKFDSTAHAIELITGGGSDRINYKLSTKNKDYIITVNPNVQENETFFYLATLLKNLNGNVPCILSISEERTAYIQTYLGKETLLERRLKGEETLSLYKKSVVQLARLQVASAQIVDEGKLYDSKRFDSLLIYRDLFYFKNYFLDFTDSRYLQSNLLIDFENLANALGKANFVYFIFRDFQARNIMVDEDLPYFIDFQDGMKGPIAYDLVSLIWQAKARLTNSQKELLEEVYTDELKKLIPSKFNIKKFKTDYNHCLLVRLLQVLGAYGKLGMMQQKPHFKESIQYGLDNLHLIQNEPFMDNFPALKKIFLGLNDNSFNQIN